MNNINHFLKCFKTVFSLMFFKSFNMYKSYSMSMFLHDRAGSSGWLGYKQLGYLYPLVLIGLLKAAKAIINIGDSLRLKIIVFYGFIGCFGGSCQGSSMIHSVSLFIGWQDWWPFYLAFYKCLSINNANYLCREWHKG